MTHAEKLAVDPIACHGLCAEMLPAPIRLDEWGYPVLDSNPLAGHRRHDIRAGVRACPTLALHLQS
jgi:ferredoxin